MNDKPFKHLIDDHGTVLTQEEIDALSDQIAYCISVAQENHDLRIAVQSMPSATKEMRANRILPEIDLTDYYVNAFSRVTSEMLMVSCCDLSVEEAIATLHLKADVLSKLLADSCGEECDRIAKFFGHNNDEGE